jgi:hypothetical protein
MVTKQSIQTGRTIMLTSPPTLRVMQDLVGSRFQPSDPHQSYTFAARYLSVSNAWLAELQFLSGEASRQFFKLLLELPIPAYRPTFRVKSACAGLALTSGHTLVVGISVITD